MERRRFTPIPLIVLGLVLLAVVLLLVGYGIPVGVGLLVGLILGFAVGTAGVLWLGAGTGRSIGAGRLTFSSDRAPLQAPFEIPDWVRDSEQVMGVEMSPLVRILVVGRQVDVSGVAVELTTIELRTTGGLAIAVAHTAPPDGRSVGSFARVAVSDDVGTWYVAGGHASGGAPFVSRYDIRFAPTPPASATRLVFRITEFVDPFPGSGPRQVAGPWEFDVPLAAGHS